MASQPESAPGRIYVPRWVQLAVLPALLIIGWFALGAIGQVIFIFLVAGLIALVLNPLVHGLERAHVPRYVGVFLVYAGVRRRRRARRRAGVAAGGASSCAASSAALPGHGRPGRRDHRAPAAPGDRAGLGIDVRRADRATL